jgi:hypothetical protein
MTIESRNCPRCDQPLTQVGRFWVCLQHDQVSLGETSSAPLHIFLSYGHDGNEKLARRIRAKSVIS